MWRVPLPHIRTDLGHCTVPACTAAVLYSAAGALVAPPCLSVKSLSKLESLGVNRLPCCLSAQLRAIAPAALRPCGRQTFHWIDRFSSVVASCAASYLVNRKAVENCRGVVWFSQFSPSCKLNYLTNELLLSDDMAEQDQEDVIKGPWSPEEDEVLKKLIEQHGPRNWSVIAQGLKGRSGKSCRLRWCNQLNPEVRIHAIPEPPLLCQDPVLQLSPSRSPRVPMLLQIFSLPLCLGCFLHRSWHVLLPLFLTNAVSWACWLELAS